MPLSQEVISFREPRSQHGALSQSSKKPQDCFALAAEKMGLGEAHTADKAS